jgi:hypothetical protein
MKIFPKLYSNEGEMLPYERFKLFNWIYDANPKNLIEIGSGVGHGSTYYMAEALKQRNEGGIIYSCDPERRIYEDLLNDYPSIKYYSIKSTELIEMLISNKVKIDYIFFDGPEIPKLALSDIKILEEYILPGTYFSMHDWCTETRRYDNQISIKSLEIRPYLENSNKWEKIEELSGLQKNSDFDDMPYDSVGLCLYRYR